MTGRLNLSLNGKYLYRLWRDRVVASMRRSELDDFISFVSAKCLVERIAWHCPTEKGVCVMPQKEHVFEGNN